MFLGRRLKPFVKEKGMKKRKTGVAGGVSRKAQKAFCKYKNEMKMWKEKVFLERR